METEEIEERKDEVSLSWPVHELHVVQATSGGDFGCTERHGFLLDVLVSAGLERVGCRRSSPRMASGLSTRARAVRRRRWRPPWRRHSKTRTPAARPCVAAPGRN